MLTILYRDPYYSPSTDALSQRSFTLLSAVFLLCFHSSPRCCSQVVDAVAHLVGESFSFSAPCHTAALPISLAGVVSNQTPCMSLIESRERTRAEEAHHSSEYSQNIPLGIEIASYCLWRNDEGQHTD
jgi:hypothetical protein